jgi:uncharacterized protein HemY
MSRKSQAAISLILPAIGAGLVFVGYNNYISVSADDPYTKNNSVLLITLIIAGLIFLAFGLFVFLKLFKGSNKISK